MQTAIMLSHGCLFTWLPCLDCSPAHVWFPTKRSGSVPRARLPTRWIEGMFKQCLWPRLLGGATHHLEPGGGSSRCFSGGQDWSGWWQQIQRAEPETFPPADGGQHKPGLHFKHLRTADPPLGTLLITRYFTSFGSVRKWKSTSVRAENCCEEKNTEHQKTLLPDQCFPIPSNYSPLREKRGLPWWLSGKESAWKWSLNWEDPTCHGATKPMHNYWACALESRSQILSLRAATTEALSRTREATIMRSLQTAARECSHCSSQLGKSLLGNKDSAKPNKKINNLSFFKKERSEENIDVDISFDYLRVTNICNLKR